MRLIAVLCAICALSQGAAAQTGDCRSITNPTALLDCYNNTAPSATTAARAPGARWPRAAKPQAAATPPPVAARPQAFNVDGSKYSTSSVMKTSASGPSSATSAGVARSPKLRKRY